MANTVDEPIDTVNRASVFSPIGKTSRILNNNKQTTATTSSVRR